MSAVTEMIEEELLKVYENVIKKAGMTRYLLQTQHGIVEVPFCRRLGHWCQGATTRC